MSHPMAIRLEGLAKIYGRGKRQVKAVDHIHLEVEAGQVYGFLGPNGAGKTTTIRMMLNLINPSAGRAVILGDTVTAERYDVLRRVGMLVEGAAFYPTLSGRRNLEVIGRINGYYDKQRIESLLQQVGLAERAKQKFRNYSLGMKQRLGLAAALLHDPELIIMDEPANGLDPAGIQEMRHFIRDLTEKQGKTVFLSSHLLNEVEQTCDRVAIINKGQILREGRVADLLAEQQTALEISAAPLDRAAAIVGEHWKVKIREERLRIEAERHEMTAILRKLLDHEIEVFEAAPRKFTLEDLFLQVTGMGTLKLETQTTPQVEVLENVL